MEARRKVQQAWMHMTAAQGGAKDMKKFLDLPTKLLKKSRRGRDTRNDLASFLSTHGKGL